MSTVVKPLEPQADSGRFFLAERKVRLDDANAAGTLRLDALARYSMDVSDDDTTDGGMPANPGWVVRASTFDVVRPAELGEVLHFTTYCSGTGTAWAERRLSIVGNRGAHYEVATLFICVDVESGRPHKLTDQFLGMVAEAADGRVASPKLGNPKFDPTAGARIESWHVRAVDFDVLRHVNNGAYWPVVEEWPAPVEGPARFRMEFADGHNKAGPIRIAIDEVDEGGHMWWWLPDDDNARPIASCLRMPLPVSMYPEHS